MSRLLALVGDPNAPLAERSAIPGMIEARTAPPIIGDGWRRQGVILARAWEPDTPPDEIMAMRLGSKRRLRHPDLYGANGMPVWFLDPARRREGERTLNRHARDWQEHHNIACNAGRLCILSLLGGLIGFSGVQYFAVGTGTPVTPAATDKQLVTEVFRFALSGATVSGNLVDLNCVIGAGLANVSMTEAGLFSSAPANSATNALCASGGTAATGSANTGMLTAHATFPYNKTSNILLTVDYDITES